MATVQELLQPIPGDNPAGENLYYSPLKRELDEAAREEDALAQGVWKREVKRADYKKLAQVSAKALKEKGKDLFVACYLCEAWARQDGFEGMLHGVELLRGMLDRYWDTLYPEIEDGDVEFRSTPLGYVASRWEPAVRSYGLTASGVDWYAYQDSIRVPSEEDANKDSDKKGRIRRQAIEDGKLTPEDLDDALRGTPSEHLEDVVGHGQAALEAIQELSNYCDEKFGEVAPNFHPLKVAIEDVVSSARILADRKAASSGAPPRPAVSSSSDPFASRAPSQDPFASRAPPSDPFGSSSAPSSAPFDSGSAPAPAADAFASSAATAESDPFGSTAPPAADPFGAPAADPFGAPAAADPFANATPAPPQTNAFISAPAAPAAVSYAPPPGDPAGAIAAGALALRDRDPANPAPYLVLRGLRWGELRAGGEEIDDLLLEAPPRETRVALKKLAREEEWGQVLATAETAMAQPCGRGWLDIQRYAVEACEALGDEYDRVSEAVRIQLWLLLHDYPDLPERTLDDDTPAANGATLAWIRSLGDSGLPVPPKAAVAEDEEKEEEPDAWVIAQRELQRGRADGALEALRRQLGREISERARFERQVQMARICLASKSEAVALPILEDLNAEIERHGLTEWEDAEMVGEPLELLHRCLTKVRPEDERLRKIYDQLCRLDPLRAMRLGR